jgi:uronate dehydrogenase
MLDCILLTGGAGRLGKGLRPGLAACCRELRVLDRAPLAVEHANEKVFQTDLTDPGILRDAMSHATAVVHFAGFPREADWATLLAANVTAVTAVWEAARAAGVGRIVYASSNHAVGMVPRHVKIAHDALPHPDSRYGVTKVFMESVASLFAAKYGVRGFGMRIGHCAPEPSDARMLSHWIHPDDLAALVRVGLEADYENEIVYGASANAPSWWDNHRAETLGYRPRHSADPHAARLADRTSADPVAEHYQGGSFAAAEYAHPRIRPG